MDRKKSRYVSPILLRILAVNVMALAILVGSLLYLGQYQSKIVVTELDALLFQSRIISSAITEGAVVVDDGDHNILSPLLARLMVRRLAETTETRTRLFAADDSLLADSRVLLAGKGMLGADKTDLNWGERLIGSLFDVMDLIHERQEYPLYQERAVQRGSHYDIVRRALKGERATQVWRSPKGGLTLAAAVPVHQDKHVLGAVMMTRTDASIDKAIYTVRIDILKIFGMTMLVTILLSLYLARAIARPIRLLALAAEGLRHGQMQVVGLAGTAPLLNRDSIPDLTNRDDEIGDLSGALRDLTEALAQRIGAIENFAADVAHEIKNPLTSLRSAVETSQRVQDPNAQRKLMEIIRDDVDRLDRLITDIASASRLDAELSRAKTEPVDIGRKLTALVDFHHQRQQDHKELADVVLLPFAENLIVKGVKLRLIQVFQNLIDNALSFTPSDKKVTLSAVKEGRSIFVYVEDEGAGIPDTKLEAIFDRFYTERPKAEKFGTHSGLGLSISKQIIEAHSGQIWAENIKDAEGHVTGARFVVQLPELVE